MGTRNLTCVVKDGNFVVAQYGQWDGYPEGQGKAVLAFLTKRGNLTKLKAALPRIKFLTQSDLDAAYKSVGVTSDWLSQEQADKFRKIYPLLHRDHGAKILDLIISTEGVINLVDEHKFAADSLFCEWAYVIDLDKKKLEVYMGFNKNPLNVKDRFYGVVPPDDASREYYPIRLKKSYDLANLPSTKQFIQQCTPKDQK